MNMYKYPCINISGKTVLCFPLSNKLRKPSSTSPLVHPITLFIWSEEYQTAFNQVKVILITTLVLAKAMFNCNWILEVDASDVALGAVLRHEQEDNEIHLIYSW